MPHCGSSCQIVWQQLVTLLTAQQNKLKQLSYPSPTCMNYVRIISYSCIALQNLWYDCNAQDHHCERGGAKQY